MMRCNIILLSVLLSTCNKKRLKQLHTWLETLLGAEGGTRTPMPVQAQRPERCVSTNFTTSARPYFWTGLYYCNFCDLSIATGTASDLPCLFLKEMSRACYNDSDILNGGKTRASARSRQRLWNWPAW